MNLHSVFEELNKLYEEDSVKTVEEVEEEVVEEEAVQEELKEEVVTEAADDEEEIEIVEDEDVEEEPIEEEPVAEEEVRLVLECANCGGLMIKTEADVKVDEETDLANVEEACQYCEAADGYKILGVVAPYGADVEEPAEEAVEESVEKPELSESVDEVSNFPEHSKYINYEGLKDAASKLTNGFTADSFTFRIDAGDHYAEAHLPKVLKPYYDHIQIGHMYGLTHIFCADRK